MDAVSAKFFRVFLAENRQWITDTGSCHHEVASWRPRGLLFSIHYPLFLRIALVRMGMRAVINLHHMLDGELCVTLSSREPLVTEHLLNSSQVGPLLQHVRSERVAKGMRMHIGRQSVGHGDVFYDPPHAACRQPCATEVHE